jgi:ribosomal protein S20
MPHHASAKKRLRQAEKRRAYNRRNKRLLKEAIKAVLQARTVEEAERLLQQAYKVIDRVAAHGSSTRMLQPTENRAWRGSSTLYGNRRLPKVGAVSSAHP